MQLFQINQSEDSSKITIKFNNTCDQLHQHSVTLAINYNRTYSSITLLSHLAAGPGLVEDPPDGPRLLLGDGRGSEGAQVSRLQRRSLLLQRQELLQ